MGSITDIINKDSFSGDYWEKAGKDLLVLLEKAAMVFVDDNIDLALGLTEDEVKGILFNAMLVVPNIPNIPDEATPAELRVIAKILKARSSAFALTMEAQKARNLSTAQLEENAKEFAAGAGQAILNALLGAVGGTITKKVGG